MKKIESVRGRERKPEINDYVYTNTEKTMRTKRARNTVEHEIFFCFGVFVRFCAELGLGGPKSAVGFFMLLGLGRWGDGDFGWIVFSRFFSQKETRSLL